MRRRLAWSVGLLAAALLAHGLYLPAKALAAQVLLHKAWTQALSDGGAHRPWPWADTYPVARLRAPDHDVDLIALAGASGQSLAFGPGHVSHSGAPGSLDTVVFGGHRDTHFRFLKDLRVGDELWLQGRDGSEQHYRVEQLDIANVFDSTLRLEPDSGQLALVTCFPFDALRAGSTQRFVVSARSVSL
ncbi:MAG: class GN sortase [Gammaproteobacteria bacterium]